MKKIYALLLIVLSAMLNASAQSMITSFTIDPPNPTSADTVRIYVQCDFSHSACDGTTFLNGINGNVIDAGGLHCMGTFTAFCTDIDTVVVPPLAAGQYSLIFILVTGATTGCIPGIIPIVVDSTNFTVSAASGINNLRNNEVLQIMPNPSCGKFVVKQYPGEECLMKIFSVEGKLMESFHITDKETEINISLAPGIYTIMTERKDKTIFSKLVVVK